MKTKILLAAIGICIIVLGGRYYLSYKSQTETTLITSSSDWVSYTDTTAGITFSYPQGWKVNKSYDTENSLSNIYIETGSDKTYKQIRIIAPAAPQFKDQGSLTANKTEIQKYFPLVRDEVINLRNSVAYYWIDTTPDGNSPSAVVIANHQTILVGLDDWSNNTPEAESLLKQFLKTIVFSK